MYIGFPIRVGVWFKKVSLSLGNRSVKPITSTKKYRHVLFGQDYKIPNYLLVKIKIVQGKISVFTNSGPLYKQAQMPDKEIMIPIFCQLQVW